MGASSSQLVPGALPDSVKLAVPGRSLSAGAEHMKQAASGVSTRMPTSRAGMYNGHHVRHTLPSGHLSIAGREEPLVDSTADEPVLIVEDSRQIGRDTIYS